MSEIPTQTFKIPILRPVKICKNKCTQHPSVLVMLFCLVGIHKNRVNRVLSNAEAIILIARRACGGIIVIHIFYGWVIY
jgi:hypothetical protein